MEIFRCEVITTKSAAVTILHELKTTDVLDNITHFLLPLSASPFRCHHIQNSPLSLSSFSLSWQLHFQHPSTSLFIIPLYMSKLSQSSCLSYFISKMSNPGCYSDVLIFNSIHPHQSQRKPQRLPLCHPQLCFLSLSAAVSKPENKFCSSAGLVAP